MFFDGVRGQRGSRSHGAIDILGALGLPIYATVDGTVPDRWSVVRDGNVVRLPGSGTNQRGGNFVTLVDRLGYYHYYAHMEKIGTFTSGQSVRAGTLIGHLGGTGSQARRRYQHLHYQVTRRNNNGGPVRNGIMNPYQELLTLARKCGGDFETLSLPGYSDNVRWMVIRSGNYRR